MMLFVSPNAGILFLDVAAGGFEFMYSYTRPLLRNAICGMTYTGTEMARRVGASTVKKKKSGKLVRANA